MRLRKVLTVIILAALAAAASLASTFPDRPKLVVLIAIDQFRYDYLTRYERGRKENHGETVEGKAAVSVL